MTYLAIAGPLCLAFFVCLAVQLQAARSAARKDRDFARREASWAVERSDLLNRVMYMAEKPWDGPVLVQSEEEKYDPYEGIVRFPEAVVED